MRNYLVTLRIGNDSLLGAVAELEGTLDTAGLEYEITDAKEEEYEVIESPSAQAEPELEP